MAVVSSGHITQKAHPLDLVEEAIATREWALDRPKRDELLVEVTGRWCHYQVFFHWSNDIGALQISCVLDLRSPEQSKSLIYELLALVNDRLGIGHFHIDSIEGLPAYRHTLLLRGGTLSAEQVEDLLDIALHETDRFYPAFQYVIWGGQTPINAIATVAFETVGEA
ncbi:MAG: YbjN domain-containing protein [Alphaproteobacteria bacterium]|nr:YbjN domain-containing protein [Alphaproteobacteria bacterium]|tara:strand:- start:558 stop:1058 length:501 start_codon:yes stop_codon:yes gene_type:complete